jgi:hypothetical protein
MPSPININNITPPRVPLTDPRTGLISREWYRFFLNLFELVGSGDNAVSLNDIQKGPPSIPIESIQIDPNAPTNAPSDSALLSQLAEVNKQLNALESQPECPCEEYNAETQLRLDGFEAAPPNLAVDLNAEVQKSLQSLQMVPQPELGTMAALQQANVPWLTFDVTPQIIPTDVGTLAWNGGTTLNLQATANVTYRLGEAQYTYVKASAAITKGQLCYHTGAVGASGVITAAPTPIGLTDPNQIIGVAAESIALNGFGLIQDSGDLRGFNTTGSSVGEVWADGDPLYYNPAYVGSMTKTKPSAPNIKSYIGEVINAGSGSSGSMGIRMAPGSVLGGTDSNVQITAVADKDLLQYDSALQYWKNVTPASVIAGATGAPVTKTANFSVANGETWLINNKSGSSCTVTLPTASSNTGRVLYFLNYQAQTLVSASSNVVPLAGGSATTAILEAVAGSNATLVSDGTNWIMTQYDSNNALQLE